MKSFLKVILLPIFLFGFSTLPTIAKNKSFGLFSSPSGDIHLDVEDIQKSSLRKTEDGIVVDVFLQEGAREKLGKLTESSIGQPMKFIVCGEEVSGPIVRAPIYSGILSFHGLQEPQAKKVNDVLNNNRICNR